MREPVTDEEDRKFLRENKQVWRGPGDRKGKWMTMTKLRKLVIAGKADGWNVVDIDLDTEEPRIICPYCATGVEHRGTHH